MHDYFLFCIVVACVTVGTSSSESVLGRRNDSGIIITLPQ